MAAKRGRSISNMGYGLFSGLSGSLAAPVFTGLVALELEPRIKELLLDQGRDKALNPAPRSKELLLDKDHR